MRKFWGVVFLLITVCFFAPKPKQASAQTGQNVVLSCLDATVLTPPKQTLNGVAYNHLISLKNRELGVFSPNQPVYIVRSLAKVYCNPQVNDPDCVKVEPENLQRCNQETMGADICNLDCPWDGGACVQNNLGPGSTRCCMINYQKPGPYFQCAKDVNHQVVCPASILSQEGQSGGIHVAEDGHIETGFYSSFIIASNTKDSLLADSEGNIFIAAAQSHTLVASDQSFYGLQVLSDEALSDNEAYNNSLKLAVFAEIETIEPSATNCTTVYWDPFGKVIDSLRLEPINNINILLRNLNSFNQIVNTNIPNNPAFRNPDTTDQSGEYNFAVNPGTYFLSLSHPDFSFPSDVTTLNRALSTLSTVDPNQEYITRDKIYNDPTEPIIEVAGESQRRDMILAPKDPNYAGSPPTILYAENLRDNDNQIIRGRVSHPKSIVKVSVGNTILGQVETGWKGSFSVTVPGDAISLNTGTFQVIAEKVPLTQAIKPHSSPLDYLTHLFGTVLAQEGTTSRPYTLSMIPVRLTGFVFDNNLQVKPNAIVKLKIPAMGNLTYSQTKADSDGFINIDSTNLPPFEFTIVVEDPKNPTKELELTIEDFKKTNTVLYEETGTNIYNKSFEIEKPDAQTIARIVKETPRRVNVTTLSYNSPSAIPRPTVVMADSTTQKSSSAVFVFAIIGALAVGGAIILGLKSRTKKQIYY